MTFKRRAHELIDSLPEEPTLQEVEEVVHQLLDNAMIDEGRRDIEEGRTFSNAEVKDRMARWLSK